MSMQADYWMEEDDFETYEDEYGFFTYKYINEEEMFSRDVFVKPEYRRTGKGIELGQKLEAIARERGCKMLTGQVWHNNKPELCARKLYLYIKNGWNILRLGEGFAIIGKEIK